MKKLLALIGIGLISIVGQAQTALDFDGIDDHVLIPGAGAILDGSNTWTIEFWVQDPDNSAYPLGINGTDYVLIHPAGTIVFYSAGGNFQSNNATWIADGNPHHVAFVSNGVNNQQIYVDGNPVGMQTQTHAGFTGIAAEDISLGSDVAFTTQVIDDLRIWDDARTPAEILANYNQCLTGTEPNLVVLYDFEDGTGSSVVTNLGSGGATYNGVLTGMDPATDWVAGWNGCTRATEALEFDGVDDYVDAPALDFSAGNSMTIEAWIKPDDITTNVYYEITRQQSAAPIDWLFSFQNNGTILSFGLNTSVGGYSELDVPIVAGDFVDGNWHHVAAVYDGANRFVYLDGNLIGSDAKTGNVTFLASTHIIGNYALGAEYFDGKMDEIRFWSCAKTQAEITSDMSVQHTGLESGLVLFYDFSDGAGLTVTDQSIYSNNGTLVNGPLWVSGVMTSGAPTFAGCPPGNDHYWVGGTGNWTDAANHWANMSGGVPGSATVPGIGDHAIFDDNSGLTVADVVTIDAAVDVDTLNFSAVSNSFVFDNSGNNIQIEFSLLGNAAGVTFTGTWGEIIFNPTTPGEIITSGGTIWQQDFRMSGTEAMTMTDNLDISTGTMFVDNGGLILSGFDLSCTQFEANVANTRALDISGANVNVTGGTWIVDPTTLTFTSTSSNILLGDNAGNASFTGGGLVYDTLRSLTATTLSYFNDNSFSLFAIPVSSLLEIDNGNDLATDSLIASGTCGALTTITTPGPGASATFTKTGFPSIELYNVQIDKVNAVAVATHNLYMSDVISGTGWTLLGSNFYWIGDTGNWNDGNNWSFSSGGTPAGCVPGIPDSVYFDGLSFISAIPEVTVDDSAFFSYMDWSTATNNPIFKLDSNVYAYGDIILNPNLTVENISQIGSINIMAASDMDASGAFIDCNIQQQTANPADTWTLSNDLVMTDTSGIVIFQGHFNTQNNNVYTGFLQTIDDVGGADGRTITLGSSFVHIKQFMYMIGTTGNYNDAGITFNAGTSHVYVGDTVQTSPTLTSYFNSLRTPGLTFNELTLNFQRLTQPQYLEGVNTINTLRVVPGSKVDIVAGSNQTIQDSLILLGTCNDSIWIKSDNGTVIDFTYGTPGIDTVTCLLVSDINASDATTAYFSTDDGNNTNWTFDLSAPVTALYTIDGPFCFGDTTLITNSTTSSSSQIGYSWNYGDGSFDDFSSSAMEAEQTTSFDYLQPVGIDTSAYALLTTWNEISDPQSLFEDVPGIVKTVTGAESMRFDFLVDYDLSLVNNTGSDAFLVDMDAAAQLVSYNYRPRIRIYKNGAPYSSSGNSMQLHKFYEDTLSNGTTLIGSDSLTFSTFVYGILPTDTLTIYIGSNVTYTSTATQPRWRNGGGTDVAVDYKLDVDTIHFVATPISSNYTADTAYHQFTTAQDSMFVTLVATDLVNLCTDTLTLPVSIYNPQVSLSSSDLDLTICQGDEVTFEGNSPDDSTRFQFYVNGIAQNTPPSIIDTLLITTSLMDGDTIELAGFEQGCKSTSVPVLYFNVNPLPVFNWTSTDADTSICAGDLVEFDAWAADSLHQFVYLLNGTSVTGFQDSIAEYATTSLVDNDIVYVAAIDTNSCKDTLSMTFNVDPVPATTLDDGLGGSSVICSGTNVVFTAAGATTYEFFINGVSQGAPSASNTWSTTSLTGTDTVTVVGYFATGCSKEAPQFFRYNVLPSPTVTLASNLGNSICSGENVVFTGSGASQYDFFINGTSVTGGFLPTDTYSSTAIANGDVVDVVGISAAGCTDTSSTITFTVTPSPTTALASSDADQIICQGESVTFTGSGATNYLFQVDGVDQGVSSPTATFTTTSLLDGQVVTVVGESNNCLVSDAMTFTVLPIPTVSLFSNDPDNTICDGDPITFTGANASQYELFVNGASQVGPQASPTFANPTLPVGANTIYVIGTAPNGCTNQSSTINVQVNPIPTVVNTSSDIDNTICAGEAVTFTGTGSNMYQFFVNGVPQGSMSATNTFTTTTLTNGQTVNIIGSSLGCTSTSNNIVTTVNPVPVVTLNSTDANNIWCEDVTVDFTASGATNYEFFVDGVSQGVPSPTNTLNSAGFAIGTYSVTVTGESLNCLNSTTTTVTVNPLPTPVLTSSDVDNTICAGESVTYTGSGGSLYEFFINGTSQGSPTALTSYTSNALADGDVVSMTITSGAGCQATSTEAPITVNPIPVVTLASSDIDLQICSGDNVDFTASGATDYEFFINGVSQGPASPTTTLSTTALSQGDVIEVIGSSLGCESTSNSMTFTVFGAPIVSLLNNGDSQICVGENTDLTATGAANYQFSINGVPTGAFGPTDTYTGTLNDGDVVTVAGETNGCSAASADSYTFTVYSYPTITSSSSDVDNIICLNDAITITASGAMEYEFLLNGAQQQYGALTTFDINTLQDGDVISVVGYNGDCPSTADTYTFTVNSMNLDLTVAPSSMICAGENATFTATGGDQYEFFLNGVSTGAMSATNTYSSTTLNDQDEVTVTAYSNTTMCTQVYGDYILMNVIEEPVITPLSSVDICEGDSVVLVSNMPYGNQWLVDGTPIAGATDTAYVAYTTGQYTLEATSGGTGTVWSFGHNPSGNFGNGDNLDYPDPTQAQTTVVFDEISSGFNFVLGVNTTGEVYAWGENSSGQLGNGTYTSSNIPVIVPTLAGIKTVSTSQSSSMAVTNAGDVYVWGNNSMGQLGTGNTSVINFPFLNAALANTDTIAGGRNHFVILKNDGTVWTVGNNDYGQLGQGNLTGSMNPVQVTGLANVVTVGAGEYHSFAIDNTGDLYVWGNNGSGQLGLNDLNNRLNPTVSPLRNVINAQGGANHSAFLTSDKKVFTSGGNAYGQLGTGDYATYTTATETNISGAEKISTGQYTTLVLRADRSVFGFGNNTEDQLSSLSGNTVNTPEHIVDLDGVDFIEASQLSSHVIYNEAHACVSAPVDVNMLAVPLVTITAVGDTLSTVAGVSYQWYFDGLPIPGATNQTYVANESGNYTVEVVFANGCSGTSAPYYHSLSGIDVVKTGEISLYPNPAYDQLNLELFNTGDATSLVMMDQTGRLVLEMNNLPDGKHIFNVSELSDGVYMIHLKYNDGATSTLRFVKSTL